MTNIEELLQLIKDNPELPIISMVDSEIVADDGGYWMGEWGISKVEEYYLGCERVHIKDDDDEEEVLSDLSGCRYGHDFQDRDIYDLPDEEWNKLYAELSWEKAIIVYITT